MSKKTKLVEVKPTKATTRKVEEFFCDVCSDKIKGKHRVCVLCKRDCHDWWEKKGCSSSDDRDYGDYPSTYCMICHDLKFDKHNQEYYDIQNECEKKEDALEAKILKESLAQGVKND